MSHQPILIQDISLSFGHKSCFTAFSSTVCYRDKIAIIGNNGVGKTSLLKMIMQAMEPSGGSLKLPDHVSIGYVPQVIEDKRSLSGGERFLKSLSHVLAQDINVLLLDEPTNHLDVPNKRSLMKMLQSYQETLIVVSHDEALLKNCINKIWDIEEGRIHVFAGKYEDYLREKEIVRDKNKQSLEHLKREQRSARSSLQFENERAARSKKNNKNRNEKSKAHKHKMKETAAKTSGKKQKKHFTP